MKHILFLLLMIASTLASFSEDGVKTKHIYTQALEAALNANDLDIAVALVKKGIDTKESMETGMPFLVKAAYFSGVLAGAELVRAFTEGGADINAKSTDGITALMVVDRIGGKEMREYLLSKGALDYDRTDMMSKARATKIDAELLDSVVHYYMVATSARSEPFIFEKLTAYTDVFKAGIFPEKPVWQIVENKGKDEFGNFFIIDPQVMPVFVFVSDETVRMTEKFVSKDFWKPFVRTQIK